jgi:hypothetical protein
MNILIVLAVAAAFGLLRFSRASLLVWAGAWWVGLYVILRFGFTAPIPASVVSIYMGIISLAIPAYVSSSEDRRGEVSGPLFRFMTEKRYRAPRRNGRRHPGARRRERLRQNERPPPASALLANGPPRIAFEITVHDKKIDLDAGENPFRHLETSNPEEFRKHVETGRQVYYRNCVFCHGDNMAAPACSSTGWTDPDQLRRPGTIRCFAETYLFWRIAKGGPRLPEEGGPWDTAMPAWDKFLKEEEIWDAILFLYDYNGRRPRAREEAASK